MFQELPQDWQNALKEELELTYVKNLERVIEEKYQTEKVFPNKDNVFRAFSLCPLRETKVVILGQDPYHGAGQAVGLSFSVPEGILLPPSLRNIYKEVTSDVGKVMPESGDLKHWAEQGILLLNTTLTVKEDAPGSHQGLGWERFTDAIIQKISEEKDHVVFLLWGKPAEAKKKLIDNSKHLILTAPHPSPLSSYRGFFGCKHFSKTNDYLKGQGENEIVW